MAKRSTMILAKIGDLKNKMLLYIFHLICPQNDS